MDIVWKMAKIIVTKANSLGVLPHLECVWLRRLHFCCFHWTRRSLPKTFSWDHPKTRLDFEKCPEQKDKSLRTPFASNYDRNRLWDVRQGCQPPPFGGPWACPRWSAGSGPTSSAFFKILLRVIHKMCMLITYITCFAIYLGTQQCLKFYFRGNISSFMTENNSSRFFWTPGTIGARIPVDPAQYGSWDVESEWIYPFCEGGFMIPVELSANCKGWIYIVQMDPGCRYLRSNSGIHSGDPRPCLLQCA